MSALPEMFSKKVGPVPVVYIAAGFAAVLGVVAWRMKSTPNTPADTGSATGDATLDANGIADGSNPYAGMSTNGTVVVQQTPAVADTAPVNGPGTNDEWVRQGALWLTTHKDVTPTAGYAALSKYIAGQSRSSQEGQWVEMVITALGFPPETFVDSPITPATTAPTPTTPTVAIVAPTGLKATAVTRNSVSLDWAPIPGAAGYSVFINGKQYGRTVLGSDYVISGLSSGTHYTLSAAGVFAGWKVGPQASITVTTVK